TQFDSSNKKEIESLQKSVNRSIAYVNAAAGLRAGLLKPVETKPGTTTKTGLTDEEQRKLTTAQKKKLDDAMRVIETDNLTVLAGIK
ncbi:hypothetical protein, partial [Pseudomonas urmiensis]|uniref:hypothetical protein n=1 Tax=Pseudomonas urmiensis TaxID=2745493 RepID=UPI0034D633CB